MKERLKKLDLVFEANAAFKARLQERKAAAEIAYYKTEAVRKGIVVLQDEKIVKALQERLKNRDIIPSFKEKGELHIFLAYYMTNWETVLSKTLKSFGRVTEFEWGSRGFDQREQNWLEEREHMNQAMLEAFLDANAKRKVDVVVGYLSGHNTDPKILQQMSEAGAIIINFCWDDKLGFRGKLFGGRWTGPAALASVVDLNLTNAPESCIKYFVEGGLAMFWPEAAHPDIHKPYDIPFEFDVSFIGGKYGWRPKFVAKLRKMGIKVACFGDGWENGPLTDEEMVKLYSRSRINLGFAGVGHSKKLMCLKGRDFEVPMSGGLYLTQDNPDLSLVYDVGKEIVTYHDETDCAQKIKWLFANPGKEAKIREAGWKRALKNHTWEKRFQEAFAFAGML